MSRPSPFTARIPDTVEMALTTNVRQTPELARFVETLIRTDASLDFGREDDENPCAEIHLYRSRDE